jgi:hypothetical protein
VKNKKNTAEKSRDTVLFNGYVYVQKAKKCEERLFFRCARTRPVTYFFTYILIQTRLHIHAAKGTPADKSLQQEAGNL